MTTRHRRPKLVLYPAKKTLAPCAGRTEADFAIYASYEINSSGFMVGTLKVVRKTDSRLLFPFVGAAPLGPFRTKEEAVLAAQEKGREIVEGDIAIPEL
jgi:hypothetical protein